MAQEYYLRDYSWGACESSPRRGEEINISSPILRFNSPTQIKSQGTIGIQDKKTNSENCFVLV